MRHPCPPPGPVTMEEWMMPTKPRHARREAPFSKPTFYMTSQEFPTKLESPKGLNSRFA